MDKENRLNSEAEQVQTCPPTKPDKTEQSDDLDDKTKEQSGTLTDLAVPEPETGHILFMDIVGFSKLPTNQQNEALSRLQKIVKDTREFHIADTNKQLLCLPTGDGMALVFFTNNPIPAVKCAQQICSAIQNSNSDISLRIGIHSGPLYRIFDINNKENVTGEGINTAQRVMDCGDAGNIILSSTVADFIKSFDIWGKQLIDLGRVKVKHGQRIHVFNLCDKKVGKGSLPKKIHAAHRRRILQLIAVVLSFIIVITVPTYFYVSRDTRTINSLAVLPFANISTEPDAEYLSDGLTGDIIDNLSQLPNLKVLARTTVFRYKDKESDPQTVGRNLGVSAVLTGKVLQRGDILIIQTDLISVADGFQLWGGNYKIKLGDLFAVQEEISKRIVEKLRLRLTGAEQKLLEKRNTENIEAYKLYQTGRYYWNKRTAEGFRKGIEYFQQAIDKDPTYALAYAGLADCYLLIGNYSVLPPKDAMPKAKAAAMQALQMDETLAEAHATLGFANFLFDWDFPRAEQEFKRSLELNPNYATAHQWYGEYLTWQGRFDEGIAEMKRALELDPLSIIINDDLGYVYYYARQYDKSIEQLHKTLEMDPNFTVARSDLGLAYAQKKMYEEAIAELRRAISQGNTDYLAQLGYVYAVAGKRTEAQKVLIELKDSKNQYVSPFGIALIYAALDEKEQAFVWFERAYGERSYLLTSLKVDPTLDNIREDSRFIDLMRRVGLTQ
jgi:TolB-like protein/class 3 adenylate cyclase/Flp pilus assembly protein TadD